MCKHCQGQYVDAVSETQLQVEMSVGPGSCSLPLTPQAFRLTARDCAAILGVRAARAMNAEGVLPLVDGARFK